MISVELDTAPKFSLISCLCTPAANSQMYAAAVEVWV